MALHPFTRAHYCMLWGAGCPAQALQWAAEGISLERCNLLMSCSSVTSHLVHWLEKEERACSACLCWEEMESTKCYCCPSYSTPALLSLGHGKAGLTLWGFSSQSSGKMSLSTAVAIGIILSEEQLHHKPPRCRMRSWLGRVQCWDDVMCFIEHRLISHADLPVVVTQHRTSIHGCITPAVQLGWVCQCHRVALNESVSMWVSVESFLQAYTEHNCNKKTVRIFSISWCKTLQVHLIWAGTCCCIAPSMISCDF